MTIKNSEFLSVLDGLKPLGTFLWVNKFAGDPNSVDHGDWKGMPYRTALSALVDNWGNRNTYFSTAALKAASGRTKDNFSRLLVIVADDIQAEHLNGHPSYLLETSPGNFQAGVFIDPDDEDAANSKLVSRVIDALADAGHIGADKSGNNIVRYVRLPLGQNQKKRESGPFDHVLHSWDPNQILSLADAAMVFGIDVDALDIPGSSSEPEGEFGKQADKLTSAIKDIISGQSLHDPVNVLTASLMASGAHPGTVVNLTRAIMEASDAKTTRPDDWKARYEDIPRSVNQAEKFKKEIPAFEGEPGQLPGYGIASVAERFEAPDYLIKGVLNRGELSVTFGDSGTMKSFVELDKAMRLGLGMSWHGHRVKRAATLVILGEGAGGYKRRMRAWLQRHELLAEDEDKPWIWVIDKAAEIYSNPKLLKEWVERASETLGHKIEHVLIDTLNTNLGTGADENDAVAIGTVLATSKEVTNGAAVTFVHHVGHGDKARERGSYAIRGNMDNRTLVERDQEGKGKVITVSSLKVKDGVEFASINLSFEIIELGRDAEGDAITSLVIVPTDQEPIAKKDGARRGKPSVMRLVKILEKQPERQMMYMELRDAYVALTGDSRNFARTLKDGVDECLLESSGHFGKVKLV